MSIDVSMIAI